MRKVALIIALMVLMVVMVFGQEDTKYTSESLARLSFLEGKAFLQRASDLGYEEAVLNTPIAEGDRLSASEGRLEVSLGRGNYLRLDQNTKVDILNLPKRGYDRIRLRVWAGNIYLNINALDKEKNTEIHTADVSVYVLEKGLYRIDVQGNEGTDIMVFQGLLEAAGEEGSNMINSGQRAVVAEGRFITRPSKFVAAADDAFGQWNQSRDLLLDKAIAQRHLPADLEEYEYELDQYGRWTDLPPYGWVWVPMNMAAGWRPYYSGRWEWLPLCGWTWMSYDPWGWAPYHYGRWGWDPVFGWYWIPMSVWGPSWVHWWWGYDYFGWAPLGWYGYPIVLVDDHYYDHWNGDYPYNSRALTVIRKDQLSARDVSKIAMGLNEVKSLGKITLTGDQSIAPRPGPSSGLTREKLGDAQILTKGSAGENTARDVQGGTAATTKTSGTSERKVVERTSKGTTTQGTSTTTPSTAPRKIRKKDDGSTYPSAGLGVGAAAATNVSRDIVGYPSRTVSSRSSYMERSLRSSSPLSRYTRGYSYSGSSPYSSSRSSSISRRSYGSSSSGSYSSSRSSSSSHSSSSSRSSSSSSRSSGSSSSSSGGGSVRKK